MAHVLFIMRYCILAVLDLTRQVQSWKCSWFILYCNNVL